MTSGRRQLQFATLEEALAEAGRLAEADRAGKLARRGSWTLGQTLGHLAAWNQFPYDGYPAAVKVPLILKLMMKVMRHKFLREGMRSGTTLRGVKGGTVGTEMLPTDEGLARFAASLERLRSATPIHPSPLLGALTKEESQLLALRHAELHLGFQDVVS